MPTWWEATLLALLAFRLTRLLGWDDLTVSFRHWLTGLSDDEYSALAEWVYDVEKAGGDPWEQAYWTPGQRIPDPRRFYLAKMIHCPWCAGWWISLAVAAGWWLWPWGTIRAALPFALSALVGLVAKNLDP